MSAQTALVAGRRAAESLMVDACTISAPVPAGSLGAWNETTMQYEGGSSPVVSYSGKCKVQTLTSGARSLVEHPAVGGEWTPAPIDVHLPIEGSENVLKHHIVTITASVNDPALVGRQFTINGLFHKSFDTARRLLCQEGI